MASDAAAAAHAGRRRFGGDILLTLGGRVGALGLTFVSTVLIARQLGPSGQGTTIVALNLALILVQFGTCGITTANPFFVVREARTTSEVVVNSIWLAALIGAALAVVGVALKVWAPSAIAGLTWAQLGITLARMPGLLAGLFLQSILLGQGRMRSYNAIDVGQSAAALALLGIGFAALDIHATGALAAFAITAYGGALAYLVALREHRPRLTRPSRALARRMLAYGMRVYVGVVIGYLVIRVDSLLVNAYLGKAQAGIYSVAAALGEGLYLLPVVVGLQLFPRIARGAQDEMTAAVFRAMVAIYGLVVLASVPLARPGIEVVFGSQYSAAVHLYYWLAPGIFSLGMVTILSNHYAGRGLPRFVIVAWVAGLALDVVINVVWLKSQGTYIASLASTISYTVVLGLVMAAFAREGTGWRAMAPRPGESVGMLRALSRRGPADAAD